MQQIAMVFFGAGIGGVLRLLFGKYAAQFLGLAFPMGTLGVNVIGSFLIGIAAILLAKQGNNHHFIQYFVMTGVLGGFTTFSTFSLDVVRLAEHGLFVQIGTYVIASVLLSILAVLLGMAFAKNFV